MKLAVIGSRTFNNFDFLYSTLNHYQFINNYLITEIVSGGAQGADTLGRDYARLCKLPIKIFPAEWDKYGKSAGYRRNVDIINACDEVVAFWDGQSKGTKHSIDLAHKANKKVTVINV
jgi:hypothetical protein